MTSTLFPNNSNKITRETKAKNILLVDDSESTNFFNKIIIERNIFAQVATATSGLKALNYIKSLLKNKSKVPEFILLDINMPEMDGWEFLKAYTSLTPRYINSKIIFSSTLKFSDSYVPQIKNLGISNYAFAEKMMTKDSIQELMS